MLVCVIHVGACCVPVEVPTPYIGVTGETWMIGVNVQVQVRLAQKKF